jgi:hypothetical protein
LLPAQKRNLLSCKKMHAEMHVRKKWSQRPRQIVFYLHLCLVFGKKFKEELYKVFVSTFPKFIHTSLCQFSKLKNHCCLRFSFRWALNSFSSQYLFCWIYFKQKLTIYPCFRLTFIVLNMYSSTTKPTIYLCLTLSGFRHLYQIYQTVVYLYWWPENLIY